MLSFVEERAQAAQRRGFQHAANELSMTGLD